MIRRISPLFVHMCGTCVVRREPERFEARHRQLSRGFDLDHGPFMLQGIPVLDLWVDMTHCDEIHHKSSDTYDKVDALDFKAGSAIVAVAAWTIANDPKPIAPHIDHAAVAGILKKAELDQMLAAIGQWKP
jgi:hypothetical protein